MTERRPERPPSRPHFQVRPVRVEDARSIGDVHAEAWQSACSGIFDPERLQTAVDRRRGTGADLTARLPANLDGRLGDGSAVLIVEADGQVVGFAHFGPLSIEDPHPEIYAFYVHPDSWGSGAAEALWSETWTQIKRTAGSRAVVLWTLSGATRARRFYERHGWIATGRRRDHDFGIGQPACIVEYRSP
ncbi:MAG: GNAT family N-acetyltransferase [Actinobacteria bacterium]|nr:GNAT family N-acetyltransferase [Actinomycetota bacterium]